MAEKKALSAPPRSSPTRIARSLGGDWLLGDDHVDEAVGGTRLLHLAEGGAENLRRACIGHGHGQRLPIGGGADRRGAQAIDRHHRERNRIDGRERNRHGAMARAMRARRLDEAHPAMLHRRLKALLSLTKLLHSTPQPWALEPCDCLTAADDRFVPVRRRTNDRRALVTNKFGRRPSSERA